jgi:dTMP kinase
LVDEVIRPALAASKTVISDRYLLANVVYQGHAGGLHTRLIWDFGSLATLGLMPDLTIVLDLPPEVAAARMNRTRDRMEMQGEEFIRRLRNGFLSEADANTTPMVVIDAARPVEVVQADIQASVRYLL